MNSHGLHGLLVVGHQVGFGASVVGFLVGGASVVVGFHVGLGGFVVIGFGLGAIVVPHPVGLGPTMNTGRAMWPLQRLRKCTIN